ncbi:hypothetical protein BsWGS_16226 [Bradybaena similaris]
MQLAALSGDDSAMKTEAIIDAPRPTDLCGHSAQYVSPASSLPSRGDPCAHPWSDTAATIAEPMDSAPAVNTAEPMDEISENGLLSAAGPRETSTGQASRSTPRVKFVAARCRVFIGYKRKRFLHKKLAELYSRCRRTPQLHNVNQMYCSAVRPMCASKTSTSTVLAKWVPGWNTVSCHSSIDKNNQSINDHLTGRDLKDTDDFGSAAAKNNHQASSSNLQTGIPGNFHGCVMVPTNEMPK